MRTSQQTRHWGYVAAMLFCAIFFFSFIGIGLNAWWIADAARAHSEKLEDLGNYGSFLQGTTGSLWAVATAFLTVAAIAASLWQLSLQRDQLSSQDEQLRAQLDSLRLQNFESSFFQLLGLHRQVLNEINCPQTGALTAQRVQGGSGSDCFREFLSCLKTRYSPPAAGAPPANSASGTNGSPESHEAIVSAYHALTDEQQRKLGYYFVNLFQIVTFVDKNDVRDKKRYTNIVRAQLSPYETVMLFYNCFLPLSEGFPELVRRYNLLKHLERGLLLSEAHVPFHEEMLSQAADQPRFT